jgi:zinc transporter ZupT
LGLRVAVPLAVTLHKVPEGIALGGIVRAAVGSRKTAMAWCVLAEGSTALGGVAGLLLSPHLGTKWILYPLGIAAGWLFYLGYHAVHEEWKRRGAAPAFVSASAGMLAAALVERGAEVWLK